MQAQRRRADDDTSRGKLRLVLSTATADTYRRGQEGGQA
jgi:hypothetical protein